MIGERLIKEIIERLDFLKDVGLNYLALDRQAGRFPEVNRRE